MKTDMNKQKMLEYLHEQSFWINRLAEEIENGKEITCAWAIDLDLPEFQHTDVKVLNEEVV